MITSCIPYHGPCVTYGWDPNAVYSVVSYLSIRRPAPVFGVHPASPLQVVPTSHSIARQMHSSSANKLLHRHESYVCTPWVVSSSLYGASAVYRRQRTSSRKRHRLPKRKSE